VETEDESATGSVFLCASASAGASSAVQTPSVPIPDPALDESTTRGRGLPEAISLTGSDENHFSSR
jgi:hypothetical protein